MPSRIANLFRILFIAVVLAGTAALLYRDSGLRPLRPAGPLRPVSMHPQDGLPPKAPNPWFFLERAYPMGEIPHELWRKAQIEARLLADQGGLRTSSWVFRGPTNVGGRVTDLAVDPGDAAIAFAGTAEGGVLRTTDSGQHWTPLFDGQPTLSIGAVALGPANPMIVYAGTGEVNPGGGSVAYGGAGIFKSTDRGATWTSLGLESTGAIGRIRIDPTDPQRIYVAAMGDLWTTGPERGVYRTTDGGTSWQRVLALSDSTGAVDLILRPDQPRTLFAAMWERIRHPGVYQYGGITCGVYKTTDGGDSWSLVGGGLPAPSTNLGRIGLSLCASQPATIHAVYADRTGYFAGVYRSTNGGTTWARVSDGALSSVFSSYGWWFGNIRTHPLDPNRIFVLGLDFYRSTNGGSTWSEVSGGMHVDHHALEFGPGANPVIYEGNDGGLHRSTNGGSAWTMLPDQPITQFYRLALDTSRPGAIYGGAQDNGTVRTLAGGLNDWTMVYGGDGFQPQVHPVNPNRIWAQYQYGNLYYSSNGGSSWTFAMTGIGGGDRHNWNTPVRLEQQNPNRMYYGTERVYRSTNGTSWTAISPDLTRGPGIAYGTLTSIDSSPFDGQVVWAGSDDGLVHVTVDGGGAWTDVSDELPDRWVTSVRTSPHARETAYVTISGFRWGEPLPHVFRTTDLGASWTPIGGNLPEAPANDIIVDPLDPNRLFVATDVGVYETYDGGAVWMTLGSNLPNVVVTQLAFDPVARRLTAATYGRSFFSYDIDQPSGMESPIAEDRPGARALAIYPNPARGGASIRWRAAQGVVARVEIFTVSGRRIWEQDGEGGSLRWDGRDAGGRCVAPGTYFVRVRAGGAAVLGRGMLVVAP